MKSSIIKQTSHNQSQQTQTLSKSKQVTINNIQSVKSLNLNSQNFESNNKFQKFSDQQNQQKENQSVLISKKYDPYNKIHLGYLEVNKKEIEKQTNTQLDSEKLKVMNTKMISEDIEKNIAEKKKQSEIQRQKKWEEDEKSKKKKSAKEKAAELEQEQEEIEKKEKEYQRLLEMDKQAQNKQKMLEKQLKDKNLNIQNKTMGQNIDLQEKQKFERFLQNKKQEKSIVVKDGGYLKPPVFQSMFAKADVIGNLNYVGEEEKKQIGPSYDQDGEIIPSSILGRPEWFQNQEKRLNGQIVTQDLYNTQNSKQKRQRPLSSCPMYSPKSISMNINPNMYNSKTSNNSAQNKLNQKIIPLQKGKFQINLDLIEQKQQNKQNAGSFINIQNDQSQKKSLGSYNNQKKISSEFQNFEQAPKFNSAQYMQQKKVVIQDIEDQYANGDIDEEEYEQFMYTIQEEEVASNIRQVKERLRQNKIKNRQYNNGIKNYLSKGDVLYLTKQERALKKFEDEQLRMKKFIQKTSKILDRNEQDSVYIQSNNFRSKQETNRALEVIQPDIIRLGENRYWQCKLRDFRTEDEKYDIYNKDAVQLEVIRRPKSSLIKSRAEGVPPFTTFTSGKFFQQKLAEGKDKLAKISHLDDREMELLEIKGDNKFKIEKNCLIKGSDNEYMNELVSFDDIDNQNFIQDEIVVTGQNKNIKSPKSKQTHQDDLMFHSSFERQQYKQQLLLQQVLNQKEQQEKKLNNTVDQVNGTKQQNLAGSQVSFVGVENSKQLTNNNKNQQNNENNNKNQAKILNRYQQFDLDNRKLQEQQQKELELQQGKRKTVYKIKRKIQDDNENIPSENVIYSKWIKEELRGTGGSAIKKFQLKV